jgi:PAS domain S-box-containing protein
MDAVSHLDIDARYPGIKNIAFTRYVSAADKTKFELQVRADTSVQAHGYPEFSIHPPGERKEYFVADYLWPMSGNQGIHGLDISAQPANLASMHYSQRSGQTVASAPFDLLQETTHRTGFVIRVPVFRNYPNTSSPEPGTSFLGAVAVTVRVFDLFKQLEREGQLQGLQLAMSDRGSTYDSSPGGANLSLFTTPPSSTDSALRHSRELSVYGRQWQLDFQAGRSFLSDSERRTPLLALLAGGLISLLLGALVFLLAQGRSHALERVAAKVEELEDSEGRWKFAIDGSGDGLWDWNVPQSTVFFSTRWKNMLGYEEDEIGNSLDEWSKRVHPEDRPKAMADLQAHLDATTPLYVNEHRIGCKDRSWKWILDRGVVLSRDASGKPLRVIGTQRDITARRNADEELRKSEANLRALVERSPIAMIVENSMDDKVVLMNRKFTELFGYTLKEVPDVHHWWPLAYPDEKYRAKIVAGWTEKVKEATLNQVEIEPTEATVACKDGSTRFVRFSLASIGDNNIVGFEDLTARKQMEDALRTSQNFLDRIIECSPSALWIADEQGTLLRMNQALRDHLHVRDEEVVGKYNVFKDNLIEAQGFMPRVKDVFEKGTATRFVTSYDTAAINDLELHQTTKVVLDVSISPILDSHGKVTNAIIQHLDITERKQAEQALQASLREKEALLKEVHHRVKNNLQVISSLLRLESRRSKQPDTKAVLDEMQGRIRSMALLHESLYRSGTFASVDLGVYLKELATQAFRMIASSSRVVHLQLMLTSVRVGMDQALPCGLLVNELISNCFKHSFPDGRPGEVHLDLAPTDESALWRLRVSDDGVGLPADFEDRRKTSLGLQLVSDLARQIGGTLTIDSKPNQGVGFTVIFKVMEPVCLTMP